MSKALPELTAFDLRLLQVFDAVVTAGSFTAAVVRLNKSKSAISTDIAALETRLGAVLCRRGRAGFPLTEHGKQIHAASRELFKGLSGFREGVRRITSRLASELTIALDDDLIHEARDRVAEAVRAFAQRNPDIFIELRAASADLVTQLVVDGTADIGVNILPRALPELNAHNLFSEEMVVCCGAGHPLFHVPAAEITFDVLSRYEWVDLALPQGGPLGQRAGKLEISARASNMESRLLLVQTGRFLGLLPREMLRTRTSRDGFRIIDCGAISAKRTCSAIFRRDAGANATRQLFLEDLRRAFQPQAQGLVLHSRWSASKDMRSEEWLAAQ